MGDKEQDRNQPSDDLDLTVLNRALQQLYHTRARIGSMPPSPATARGRFGGILVGLVRRSLFWLWPQLDQFHAAMISFAENQLALMEELREHLIDIDHELEQLRQGIGHLELSVTADETAAEPAGRLWLHLVKCQAQIEAVQQGKRLQGMKKTIDRLG